ncbi:hypothetical protein J6590_102381 [Homalodisca vitripennis]|nr:hypothetical protein J6590_102381 [Homalodisca vitripennis]
MENLQREQVLRNVSRLRKHNNCVSAGRNYDYKKGFMELRDPFVTEYFLKTRFQSVVTARHLVLEVKKFIPN